MTGKSQREDLFKARLEEERARLRVEIGQLGTGERANLGYGNHMADDATEAFEQAKDLALRRNLEHLLGQVENALEKLGQGTYGVCERCGQSIDPARLKVIPYANLCLDCQHRQERK